MTTQLDCRAAAPLETSESAPWELPAEYYGSIDHHDGFAPSLPRESQFRHQGWATMRRRIYASMLRTGVPARRVQHFAECGSSLWVMRDGQTLELQCNCCHDRLCLPCQKQRQAAVVEGVLLKMLDGRKDCRFVTLTLKHGDSPLSVQLERLVTCFKSLRKHPDVAPKLTGGAWFIEVKLSKNKAQWHPHLHVIAEGDFIDLKKLSRAWLHVTGDSYIVDIAAIGDPRRRASYVTKYSTKPLHPEVTRDPIKLDEFVSAIKGKRLYQCFGTWSKAVQREKSPSRNLERLGRVDSLWLDARAGDVQAMVILHQLHAKWPKLRTAFPLHHPTLSDEEHAP